ncbi:MAG: trehalose-phosphatase [Acidimicrobiia bacterium]
MTAAGALAPLLLDPGATGVFSDFDGTLSPIVDDPAAAEPLPGAPGVLADLARHFGRVGVISGRPAEFLLRHLGDAGVSMWGLHGLETVEDGRVVPVPEAAPWVEVVEEAAEQAVSELGPDVDVERKGLSLTVHFRRARQQGPAAQGWARRTVEATGLVLHDARMSYELRPPVAHGKGLVLERAAEGLRAACFFGDDLSDAEAFDALDRLAARGVTALRVGVRSEEAPPQLLERADVVLDGPEAVVGALRTLADAAGGQ